MQMVAVRCVGFWTEHRSEDAAGARMNHAQEPRFRRVRQSDGCSIKHRSTIAEGPAAARFLAAPRLTLAISGRRLTLLLSILAACRLPSLIPGSRAPIGQHVDGAPIRRNDRADVRGVRERMFANVCVSRAHSVAAFI